MPTRDKVTSLNASTYEELSNNIKVFNSATTNYHLWIYLNAEDVRDAYFIGAKEIGHNADNLKIFPDTFVRESTCWIRVNFGYLGNKVGKHIIKLDFVNRYTDDDFSLYVGYYLQNNNPDKPYVYMHNEDEDKAAQAAQSLPTFTPYEG